MRIGRELGLSRHPDPDRLGHLLGGWAQDPPHGLGPTLAADDDADIEYLALLPAPVHVAVAAELFDENRAALSAQIALDEQDHHRVAVADDRDGVGPEIAESVRRTSARSGTQPVRPISASGSAARKNAANKSCVASWWMTGETVSIAPLVQLRLAEWPDQALELGAGDLRQGVGVAAPRPLAVGSPEAGQEAVLDQRLEPALGDPTMAVRQVRRQLSCDDVALDEPQQERPVTLGQRRSGGHARSRPNERGADRGAHRPPRRRAERLSRALADR